MIRFFIQCTLLLIVLAFAWRRGEWPEKAAASMLVAHIVIDQAIHAMVGSRGTYEGLHPWHFPLDCLLLSGSIAILLKADRLWPILLGSAATLSLTGHLLRWAVPEMFPNVYAILERYPFWIAILVTGVGTWLHDNRKRRQTAPNI